MIINYKQSNRYLKKVDHPYIVTVPYSSCIPDVSCLDHRILWPTSLLCLYRSQLLPEFVVLLLLLLQFRLAATAGSAAGVQQFRRDVTSLKTW